MIQRDQVRRSHEPYAEPRVDLLGAQVAALRKREITIHAYFILTWNPELAARRAGECSRRAGQSARFSRSAGLGKPGELRVC
jgi:hypothetical protein